MNKNTPSNKLLIIRDGLIIIGITVLLLIAFEATVRIFFPQIIQSTQIHDKSLALTDTLLGHVYRNNSHQTQKGPEFSVEYKINRDGMRDETPHLNPKPSGETRILLLGDSFTFGAGVDYDKIWPTVFEHKLREKGYNVSVVKAGVSGYDTRREALYLERLYSKYNPDIVILAFLPNDLFTNTPIGIKRTDYDRTVRRLQSSKMSHLQGITLAKRLFLKSDYLYSKIYSLTARKEYFSLPESNRLKQQIGITKNLLLRVNSFCQRKRVRFLVLSIPQQFQVLVKANNFKPHGIDVNFIDNIFSKFANNQGFTWIPTLSAIAKEYKLHNKDLYFRLDGHLNNEGNHLVGKFFSMQFINKYEKDLSKQSVGSVNISKYRN